MWRVIQPIHSSLRNASEKVRSEYALRVHVWSPPADTCLTTPVFQSAQLYRQPIVRNMAGVIKPSCSCWKTSAESLTSKSKLLISHSCLSPRPPLVEGGLSGSFLRAGGEKGRPALGFESSREDPDIYRY